MRAAALVGCVLAVSVCGEQGKFPTTPGGGGGGGTGGADNTPPVVKIILPAPPHDTVQDITDSLKFTVADTDDVRLKSVQVTVKGLAPYSFTPIIDSAVVGVAGYSKGYALVLPHGGAGRHVTIEATALDASGNLGFKTDTIYIVDQKPPTLTMSAPGGATTIGAGGTLKVIASASDPSGIRYLGARVYTLNQLNQRVVLVADSNVYPVAPATAAPLNKTDTITVRVPASTGPGSYLLQAYTRDSSPTPNDTVTGGAGLNVITVLAPFGSWSYPPQDTIVVAGDSFIAAFRARDSAGVASLAFTAYSVSGDSSLGTFTTRARYTAIGATLGSPQPTDTTIRRYFRPTTDSTVDSVFLAATVTNVGNRDTTIRRRIQVVKGPYVQVTKPLTGSRVPSGPVNDSISITGYSPNNILRLGFTATGVAAAGDSVTFAAPLQKTQSTVRFLNTPATTPLGVDTIVPFAVTGLGVRFTGRPILVTFADTVKPLDTIQIPTKTPIVYKAVGDSVFVQTHVLDNRGVDSVILTGVAKRGSVLLGTDTVVTRYTPRKVVLAQKTDTVITRYLRAATPLDSTGEYVYMIATAYDSSGNFRADTTQIRIVSGPKVSFVAPGDSTTTSPNKIVTITIKAQGPLGVRVLGYRTTGVVTDSQSVGGLYINGALSDTLTFTHNLTIPAGISGTFYIVPFAADSNGNPSAGVNPRTVFVQPTATSDTTPPLVVFTVPLRVEAGDSVTVVATDPGGIGRVGFIARDTAGTVLHGDSLNFPGVSTYISQTFRLGLDTITTFPRLVKIEAFAIDSVGNRGVSSFNGKPKRSPADQDTLTLVAGRTILLPTGSAIGDAIVNPNRNELYLTNTPFDRLEVFDLTTLTRKTPIQVGSRPVGIALWPRDTLGNNKDSVIVANSGGTNLSLVSVATGVEFARRLVPNWSLGTLKTQRNAGGGIDFVITHYELADRPQYLATTCRKGGVTACDSVIVVYSTTPSTAQPQPFTNRGYVAWENITATVGKPGAGHLFYEQAPNGKSPDTLFIIAVRDTIPGVPIRDTIVGPGAGFINDINLIAFQESTFVRNSGNFVRALLGEGGFNQGFARAMMYDASRGVVTVSGSPCTLYGVTLSCTARVDSGVSPAEYVSDLLVNHASTVRSIATNFNGRTNLIRSDSIYAFDWTLKQTGLMQIGSGNPGMDFDRNNAFDADTRTSGTLNKNSRLVFAARPDASFEIFDTYWYQPLPTGGIIPVRDSIIGPIRVDSVGSNFVLAGVTTRGVVLVQIPTSTLINPFLVRQPFPVTGPTTPRPRVIPPRPAQVLKRSAILQ